MPIWASEMFMTRGYPCAGLEKVYGSNIKPGRKVTMSVIRTSFYLLFTRYER